MLGNLPALTPMGVVVMSLKVWACRRFTLQRVDDLMRVLTGLHQWVGNGLGNAVGCDSPVVFVGLLDSAEPH